MFVVYVGGILTTFLGVQALGGAGEAPAAFIIGVAVWLWFTVLFANFAEALAEGSKGQGIIGVGRLVNESWEDKDGTKRYATKVELERAHFISSGPATKALAKSTPKPSSKGERTTPPPSLENEFPLEEHLPF